MNDDRTMLRALERRVAQQTYESLKVADDFWDAHGPDYRFRGDDIDPIYRTLLDVARAEGIVVQEVPSLPYDATGLYNPLERRIRVLSGLQPEVKARSLLHEEGHLFTPNVERYTDRIAAEIVAESAAFIVGSKYGFDTYSQSSAYLAGWVGPDQHGPTGPSGELHGDWKQIRAMELPILQTAARLGSAIERQMALHDRKAA